MAVAEKEVMRLIDLVEREKSLLNLALANNSGRLLEELKARSKEVNDRLAEIKHMLSDGLRITQVDLESVKLG